MTFPINRIPEVEAHPDRFKLIEKIPLTEQALTLPLQLHSPHGDEKSIVFLDTETTGLDTYQEEIIELGLVKATYSPSMSRLTSIQNVLSEYQDPKRPIPDKITQLTGIEQHMVENKSIDVDLLSPWFSDNPLIIAHNANFDRPFFDRTFPMFQDLSWACSVKEVNWQALGFESAKLEYLLLQLGFFYQGHRAATDCLALAWLFYQQPEAFEQLLMSADEPTTIIHAYGAPFAVKDRLKERGYRWFNGNASFDKHWWKEVKPAAFDEERDFLLKLYPQASHNAHFQKKDAKTRYS